MTRAEFPAADRRPLGPELTELTRQVRELSRLGRAVDAAADAHRLMDESAGIARTETLLVYADYLLRRGRPFSARCALMPLLRRKPAESRAKLLYAQALAEAGKLPKAIELTERLANAKDATSMDAAKLFDKLYALGEKSGNLNVVEPIRARLAEQAGRDGPALFAPDSLGYADTILSRLATDGRPAPASRVEPWGYYLGEYCRQHLDATWKWRQRIGDSTMTVEVGSHTVEFTPSLWARWRLENKDAKLAHFVRTLYRLKGTGTGQFHAVSGIQQTSPGATDEPGNDLLSQALKAAEQQSTRGAVIAGLGLSVDCPFAHIRIPLLVDEDGEPVVVILQEPGESDAAFRRWLDMLCLTRFGRAHWQITTYAGTADDELRFYQRPDPPVRAALLARRLCSDTPAKNARWAVTVIEHLLDTTLDGTVDSLGVMQDTIWEDLRAGTPSRWGPAFDDRYAILFLLTCYAGEVLRVHYGGRWGNDRLTGRPIGPTSGLELSDLRFNLGAKVLKTFYLGNDGPFVPSAAEYARRAVG